MYFWSSIHCLCCAYVRTSYAPQIPIDGYSPQLETASHILVLYYIGNNEHGELHLSC